MSSGFRVGVYLTLLLCFTGCNAFRRDSADNSVKCNSTQCCKTGSAKEQAGHGPVAPPRLDVPGLRGDLSLGKIYVPDFFSVRDGESVDIVVWFLGASWCTEQVFYDANKNGVLITVTTKDLWETFRHGDTLDALLSEGRAWLSEHGVANGPVGRVCLGSFSGGYVAIREVLKQDRYEGLITDVVLADSLYSPRVQGSEQELDPEAMAPFLDYAKRAVNGDCVFVFSHLYPPKPEHRGNTTTLAANFLVDRIGAEPKEGTAINCRGAKLAYRCDVGEFHVLGYYGMTTQDHLDHLYAASDLLKMISFVDVQTRK